MRCPKWVRAEDINRWADSPQAKALLPDLLRRLVYATVDREHLIKIDFPSEAETQRPGYDGTTVTAKSSPFVPEGICFWELSCNSDPKQKADNDYAKRIRKSEELRASGGTENLSEASYIAVTTRDWQNGDTWAKDRTREGNFKEVRTYDSNSLEHWIQDAPAVGLWMAQTIRGKCDGVWDIGSYWKNVQGTLRRTIPPGILLVNRDRIGTAFADWLNQPSGEMAVKSPSPNEMVAVFCAWVHTLLIDRQNAISSRTIIVEDRETWRQLATSRQPLILVAAPRLDSEPELFTEASRQGHHVLRFAGFTTARSTGAYDLDMMRRFDLEEALRAAEIPESEARQLAKAAGGNFTILQRRFARSAAQSPPWAKDGDLAPLLLAASWQDNRQADQEILAKFAEKKYSEIQAILAKWRLSHDPPVRLTLGTWAFLSPLDAWESLHPFLSASHMDRFQQAAVEILSEDNPAFDLPASERYLASIKGKIWRFSPALRRGIAEMLALCATREQESGIGNELHSSNTATLIISRVLPDGSNWKRWASLGDLLSLFVEAAPSAVLRAMEQDLKSNDPQLVELFRQEVPGAIIGAVYHSGVLWALETAAWPADQLVSVTRILARLAELDPGGTWDNRPKGSVARIFFPRWPQTMASVDERITAFEYLVAKEPKGSWKVILSLLPTAMSMKGGIVMGNVKPSYRNWAAGWPGQKTNAGGVRFQNMLIENALSMVGIEPARWVEFLDHVVHLQKTGLQQVLTALDSVNYDSLDDKIRSAIWEKLRKLVQDHTYFRDDWKVLSSDELTRITILRDKFAPNNLVAASICLFADDGHMEGDKAESYETKTERRLQKRQKLLRSIWNAGGLPAILELTEKVRQPWSVGVALAREIGGLVQPEILPFLLSHANQSVRQMVHYFGAQRIFTEGHDWAERQISDFWTPEQTGLFATQMPVAPRTWDWVALQSEDAATVYWREINLWGGINLGSADNERAVAKLLAADRAWAALQYLVHRIYAKHSVTASIVCDVLEAAGQQSIAEPRMDVHDIHSAIEFLQNSPEADEDRVAQIEFAFLWCLDRFSRLPLTLQRLLSKDPIFFVDCLKILYLPHHRIKDASGEAGKTTPDPMQQLKAERIWQLLHDWQVIPGTEANGISEEKLKIWFQTARALAREADRLEVCDITIGQLLARSSEDADGARPVTAVRNIMEDCESEQLFHGYHVGLHNLRGTVSKGIYAGGNQERELAAQFKNYANLCTRWPHVAAVHNSMAADYLREAEREDEQAKARD